MSRALPILLFLFLAAALFAQNKQTGATIYGTIKDEQGEPLFGADIYVEGTALGAASNEQGYYELKVPAGDTLKVIFSFLGYQEKEETVFLQPGERERMNVILLKSALQIPEVAIEHKATRREVSMQEIDPKKLELLPNPSGSVEMILKTMPGVVSNNELSSRYSVRGGNYDENLVYVNDFEIYRPLLIRSGQQEGLSFINADLVQSIKFSSGGFQSKYGDKMSSVLDIQYKKPKDFKGSVAMSFLGGAAHLEGSNENHRFKYLLGVRQKSNQYLLSSLEMKGEYTPSHTDLQAYVNYDLTTEWELELLGNYSNSRFTFVPESVSQTTGVINNAIRLNVYFDGQEADRYKTLMGGIAALNKPRSNMRLKWLASVYNATEKETFDIIGEYFLYAVETDLGKEDFGQELFSLGWGGYHNWARNYLNMTAGNVAHKGYYDKNGHYIQWGAKAQYELIYDQVTEWVRWDSAGYSLPYDTTEVLIREVLKTETTLSSMRLSGYLQDSWTINKSREMVLTGGLRVNYWELNKELLLMPRLQASYKPLWEKDILFSAAAGFYHQPPFYRELRDMEGNVNKDLKAQKSAHFVLGSNYFLKIWERPFKLTTEVYFKHMWDLVPYEYDNVLIRYFGDNMATGYVGGIDIRLYGEFIKNEESWVSLSLMQTKENLEGDFFTNEEGKRIGVGYIPRPTDQFLTFGMFFQDNLPKKPNFKVHLNMLFGTGLPVGPPDHEKYRDTLRLPPYRRVDIGFSALLLDTDKKELAPNNPLKHLRTVWASLEVFNLLQIKNTISYLWVNDLNNVTWAIPNHLTSRRINLKVIMKF